MGSFKRNLKQKKQGTPNDKNENKWRNNININFFHNKYYMDIDLGVHLV